MAYEGKWKGIVLVPGEPRSRGYLLDAEGRPWGEFTYRDEEPGLGPIFTDARYPFGEEAFAYTHHANERDAALEVARFATGPLPEGSYPDLGGCHFEHDAGIVNGVLEGLSVWDVEWRLNPALMPPDADFATQLLFSSGNHPFTRVLGKDEAEAIAYAVDWLRRHDMDPSEYVFEAHPSEKDL